MLPRNYLSVLFFLAIAANGSEEVKEEYAVDILYDIHVEDGKKKEEGIQPSLSSEFARVRFTAKAEIEDWAEVKMSMDFSDSDKPPKVKDAYAAFKLTKEVNLAVGRMKILGGMDQSLSKTGQFLLDRSLANNLYGLGRYDAAQFEIEGKEIDFYANIFQGFDLEDNAIRGWAAKAIFYITNKNKYHKGVLGVNANSIDAREDVITYDLETNIFTAGSDGYKINRPNGELLDYTTLAFDSGWRFGRWLIQGEVFQREERDLNNEVDKSTGYYCLINRTFGGVRREYSRDAFEPDVSSIGGVEFSLRYSAVDLVGEDFEGEASVVTAGMNFYLNKRSKLAFQYEYGGVIERKEDDVKEKDEKGVLSFRMQYEY